MTSRSVSSYADVALFLAHTCVWVPRGQRGIQLGWRRVFVYPEKRGVERVMCISPTVRPVYLKVQRQSILAVPGNSELLVPPARSLSLSSSGGRGHLVRQL